MAESRANGCQTVRRQHKPRGCKFLQYLNKTVFAEFPNALMIAEEATAFPKVTMPVHEGDWALIINGTWVG